MEYLSLAAIVLTAYLIGAIPFGWVLVRVFLKMDIRTIGSGGTGATNVLRTGYKSLALATMILDMAKPFLAYYAVVGVMGLFYGSMAATIIVALYDVFVKVVVAAAVILGHCYPIYLKFKGGKGVAAAAGTLMLFSFPIMFMAFGTWFLVLLIGKRSSVAALVAVPLIPAYIKLFPVYGNAAFNELVFLFYVGAAVFIYWTHRKNILRLVRGEEPKVSFKKKK